MVIHFLVASFSANTSISDRIEYSEVVAFCVSWAYLDADVPADGVLPCSAPLTFDTSCIRFSSICSNSLVPIFTAFEVMMSGFTCGILGLGV